MKRFEFQYETLATRAKREERDSATRLAQQIDAHSEACQRIASIRSERRRALEFLESPDVTHRRFLSGFLEASGEELATAHAHVEECASMIEEARTNLQHTRIERRRFDRLRERAHQEHKDTAARISERAMDEIAMRLPSAGS